MAASVGAVTLVLAGCTTVAPSSKEDYKAVFSQVIRKSLAESTTNNVCLPPIFGMGPMTSDTVEVDPANEAKQLNIRGTNQFAQLRALETAGLLSAFESERTVKGATQKVLTFRRTSAGNKAFSNGVFCYARAELDSVSKWKGPVKFGEYQAAWVYYTVKTTEVADWARSDAIAAAFPTVAGNIHSEPAKVRQVAIDLSSDGWDIAEYSKLLQLQ